MPHLLHHVTGGSRSGKSRHAQALAESISPTCCFVATCPVVDDEMAARIARHRADRDSRWQTIEEQVDLPAAIATCPAGAVILIDCITLWVNNLLYHAQQRKQALPTEDAVRDLARATVAAARAHAGSVIFVSNEIGLGIVPADPITRRYRDLVGAANQILAQSADSATLMVSGIAMELK